MRERGFGRILSVSSSAAREPIPALLLSTAHRSALLATFKLLPGRLAADGITLNTLLPGRFGTDRLLHLHGSMEAAEEAARDRRADRAARHDRGDRRRRRLPLLGAGELHHRRGAAGRRRPAAAPPDARPAGRHPRLPVRPRRRADADREGARRRLEADVRRVPALARTSRSTSSPQRRLRRATWTASRARTACARSSKSRGDPTLDDQARETALGDRKNDARASA